MLKAPTPNLSVLLKIVKVLIRPGIRLIKIYVFEDLFDRHVALLFQKMNARTVKADRLEIIALDRFLLPANLTRRRNDIFQTYFINSRGRGHVTKISSVVEYVTGRGPIMMEYCLQVVRTSHKFRLV